jgi:spermidine synthase
MSAGLRRFFFFTAGCTGAAILIVEILGAKLLAPWFGTSHFVWTAQIAVTLVSLACGYYLGGRWVDRSANPARLYAAVIAAGIYLAAIIPFIESISYACLNLQLALGSLVCSAFLFFVPLTLLAMVGPYLIRVLTQSVETVGSNVGRLSAVSTLGSVAGTMLISYLLIPLVRNSVTLIGTALALVALGLAYFLAWGRRGTKPAAVAALVLSAAVGGFGVSRDQYQGDQSVELLRVNSDFGQLQVIQSTVNSFRVLENDYLTQNTYDPATGQSTSSFTYLLEGLARMYATNVNDVLCIGLGVGIVPMQFAKSGSRVDVVEINPAVVPIAEKFFDLQPAKLNIFIEDGRCYLNRCTNRYDVIALDAFLGDSPPSHLMTREAFASMRQALKPGGTLVINTFARLDAGRDFLGQSLARTLREVFGNVRIHGVYNGNTMYVASARPTLEPLRPPDLENIHPRCFEDTRDTFRTLIEPNPAAGIVLTDDFNPSDFRDAANREQMRRGNALAMRRF